MCNCVSKIKFDISGDSTFEESIVFVDIQEMETKIGSDGKATKTSTTITIGKRFMDSAKIKKQKFSLVHIYCPFCGVKYER